MRAFLVFMKKLSIAHRKLFKQIKIKENYSVDEIKDANRRIADYNMAQQQFEEDVLVLLWLKAKFCVNILAWRNI